MCLTFTKKGRVVITKQKFGLDGSEPNQGTFQSNNSIEIGKYMNMIFILSDAVETSGNTSPLPVTYRIDK